MAGDSSSRRKSNHHEHKSGHHGSSSTSSRKGNKSSERYHWEEMWHCCQCDNNGPGPQATWNSQCPLCAHHRCSYCPRTSVKIYRRDQINPSRTSNSSVRREAPATESTPNAVRSISKAMEKFWNKEQQNSEDSIEVASSSRTGRDGTPATKTNIFTESGRHSDQKLFGTPLSDIKKLWKKKGLPDPADEPNDRGRKQEVVGQQSKQVEQDDSVMQASVEHTDVARSASDPDPAETFANIENLPSQTEREAGPDPRKGLEGREPIIGNLVGRSKSFSSPAADWVPLSPAPENASPQRNERTLDHISHNDGLSVSTPGFRSKETVKSPESGVLSTATTSNSDPWSLEATLNSTIDTTFERNERLGSTNLTLAAKYFWGAANQKATGHLDNLVEHWVQKQKSNDYPDGHAHSPHSGSSARPPFGKESGNGDHMIDAEVLVPNPESKEDFSLEDNTFAFTPDQLKKLLSPKKLSEVYALGDLYGSSISPTTKEQKTSEIAFRTKPIGRKVSTDSIQSLVDSLFSTTSLSSASTVPSSYNAYQRIITILTSDSVLKDAFQESTIKTSAGKFTRNFGTLIRRFARELKKEATCWNEQRAAQFIRKQARRIAEEISETVYLSIRHEDAEPKRHTQPAAEESSDDSDSGEEDVDEFFELEKFIVDSLALRNLRADIRGFLGLGKAPVKASIELGTGQLLAELPFAGEFELGMVDEQTVMEQNTLAFSQIFWPFATIHQKVRNLISSEPSIPKGFSRIRRRCVCGEMLFDDYQELKPGAAKHMEDYLRRFSHKVCAQNNKTMTERISNLGVGLKGLVTSVIQRLQHPKIGQQPVLPNTEARNHSNGQGTTTPAHTSGDLFFLLLCHNDGIGAEVVKLRQPNICVINNDQKLFNFLHQEYKALRIRWWTWISLWTLQSIKYVRFELHENELVDIKRLDEVPPPTKDNEYRHGPPNPPELNPPLGSTLLMHLFKHPELAGQRSKCLKKIPRKLRNRLAIVDEDSDTIGWGLQFIEGWSKKRLMYLTALTVGLSSLVVMILVSALGHDVQNAGAIASFMLSFLTIGIATAQAALHMS